MRYKKRGRTVVTRQELGNFPWEVLKKVEFCFTLSDLYPRMLEFLHFPFPTAEGWQSFPLVANWSDLLNKGEMRYSNGSHPNQPACKLTSDACSEAMYCEDLCFWHRHRMAPVTSIKCACGTFRTTYGDWTGRFQARTYYNLPPATTGAGTYCCGSCWNSDSEAYTCGPMAVGYCCSGRHQSKNLVSLHDDD